MPSGAASARLLPALEAGQWLREGRLLQGYRLLDAYVWSIAGRVELPWAMGRGQPPFSYQVRSGTQVTRVISSPHPRLLGVVDRGPSNWIWQATCSLYPDVCTHHLGATLCHINHLLCWFQQCAGGAWLDSSPASTIDQLKPVNNACLVMLPRRLSTQGEGHSSVQSHRPTVTHHLPLAILTRLSFFYSPVWLRHDDGAVYLAEGSMASYAVHVGSIINGFPRWSFIDGSMLWDATPGRLHAALTGSNNRVAQEI